MKIMIDTNIFISTILFPNGVVARSFQKALVLPYEPVVCDYIVDELKRKFNEKFSDRISSLENFISIVFPYIKIIPTPMLEIQEEKNIRDIKDRPIIRSAINYGIDYLLTGDKDFLEAEIAGLKIISVQEFLAM